MSEKLRKCEDCEGLVSKRAATCPHCGAPQKNDSDIEEEKRNLLEKKRILLQKKKRLEKNKKYLDKVNQIILFSSKRIFWKFNIVHLVAIPIFIISLITFPIKYFWENQINHQFLKNEKVILKKISEYNKNYQYDQSLKLIDYYNGFFFSHKVLDKEEDSIESRMMVYQNWEKVYANYNEKDESDINFACLFLEENSSKDFLYKEFLDARIALQFNLIKTSKEKFVLDDIWGGHLDKIENLKKIEKSYNYLNFISNNLYLNEFNSWEILNRNEIEKLKKIDTEETIDCKNKGILYSALDNPFGPTDYTGVRANPYCKKRYHMNKEINEYGPSEENPCGRYKSY
jgi:hypothetical protein